MGRLTDGVANAINQKDCELFPDRAGAVGEDWDAGDDLPTQQLVAQVQRTHDAGATSATKTEEPGIIASSTLKRMAKADFTMTVWPQSAA